MQMPGINNDHSLNGILLLLIVVGSCLTSGAGCEPRSRNISDKSYPGGLPDMQDLLESLRERQRLLLIYGTQDSTLRETYRRYAREMAAQSDRLHLEVRSDREVSRAELQSHGLLVIGTPRANRITAALLPRLPVDLKAGEIRFDRYSFQDSSTAFSLNFYPSPYNPAHPLLFVSGLSDDAIFDLLRRRPRRRSYSVGWSFGGYEFFQHGRRVLFGKFDDTRQWRIDSSLQFAYLNDSKVMRETEHFIFRTPAPGPADAHVKTLAGQWEANLKKIEMFTGKKIPSRPFCIEMYRSGEEKSMMTFDARQTHIDPEVKAVHTILNDIYAGSGTGSENELWLRQLLGRPETHALERGLAIHFTDCWQFRGYAYWAGRLHSSGNLLPLSSLLNNSHLETGSGLIFGAMAGSFVTFLIEYWGRESFLNRYARWRPAAGETVELEQAWHRWLDKQPGRYPSRTVPAPLPYLKGFNFAHEGYDIYNGYLSEKARASLNKLSSLSANAVAIIPYSGMRDPRRPPPIRLSRSPGSENDAAVVHAAHNAARLGMSTMLKPQIWIGRGSWPGDIEMKNEADWQAFFQYYHEWILHYAMLAEIHGIDLLCIGTEFAKATLQREGDWRQLIRKIRGIYSGRITYAANWGQEFEQLAFWDALDYIGLNCYYPLSDDPGAGPAALRTGFREILTRVKAVAKSTQKPLLFTEIGFTSAATPWIHPHEDGRGRPYQPAHQRLCYEIVLEEIAAKPWCEGIFWWKFPTMPEYTGRRDSICFTPNNKPAQEVVARWFARMGK